MPDEGAILQFAYRLSNFRRLYSSRSALAAVLYIRLGPVAAGGGFGAPFAVLVLVFDDVGLAGRALFLRGPSRRRERGRVGGKRLRERAVRLIGPALVVPDDLIGHVCHRSTCELECGFMPSYKE